jgi:hypothetical protein
MEESRTYLTPISYQFYAFKYFKHGHSKFLQTIDFNGTMFRFRNITVSCT